MAQQACRPPRLLEAVRATGAPAAGAGLAVPRIGIFVSPVVLPAPVMQMLPQSPALSEAVPAVTLQIEQCLPMLFNASCCFW